MQPRRNIVNQPALVPIAGHCDRKPRSLDRDVTTIGRARGSDFVLEANEISTLHCIIYRTADGYRIRDCNSRCGTRVNGQSVRTGVLHDTDIINLGPFSFQFHLPAALFGGGRLDPIKVEHLKESRRRLAQRALKLRKRALGVSPREQEWVQKGHLLKEKIRCYDQRLGELEAAEEELAQERRQLADETERHRQHVQKLEGQLADRLAKADQEIRERWQEFQRRCQADEARVKPQTGGASEGRLREIDEQYTRRQEQLQREQQEFNTMKEQWVNDQARTAADLEHQHAALAQKRADLVRMMGDLKKMQEDLRKQAKPDIRALHEEIDRLQREIAEARALADENERLRARVDQLESSGGPAGGDVARQIDDLRTEIDLLHEELQNKEKILDELAQPAGAESGPLQAENALLKKLLEEKDHVIEEYAAKAQQAPRGANDLERYEAELNEFRQQLEGDRTKLNKEVEMLRDRNKELDEAIREMEMEMSKERAELARERMRLERVREEVKADSERLQRELAVRDTLGPVQKLRDELNGKQPPVKNDKPLNDRLRGIRNQLADSHPSGS